MATEIRTLVQSIRPQLVINQAGLEDEKRVYGALAVVSQRYLDLKPEHLATLPDDPSVRVAVRRMRPVLVDSADSPFGQRVKRLVDTLLSSQAMPSPELVLTASEPVDLSQTNDSSSLVSAEQPVSPPETISSPANFPPESLSDVLAGVAARSSQERRDEDPAAEPDAHVAPIDDGVEVADTMDVGTDAEAEPSDDAIEPEVIGEDVLTSDSAQFDGDEEPIRGGETDPHAGVDEAEPIDVEESFEPLTSLEQSEQPTQILPTIDAAEQREGGHPDQEGLSSNSSAEAHQPEEHEDEGAVDGLELPQKSLEENRAMEMSEGIENADNLLDALSPEELDAFDEMEIGVAAGPEDFSVADPYSGKEDASLTRAE